MQHDASPAAPITSGSGTHNGRRVLLIGGAGYVGGPLTTYLLGTGYRIRTLDRLIYRNGESLLAHLSHPNYEFQFGDMGDPGTLDRALNGCTDVVILAGLVGDPITKAFPGQARAINRTALRRCIDGLNGRGLGRVIFISTCSNYGKIGGGEIADETYPLNPLSLYAEAKVEAERYILALENKVDYCPTVLRFATAFGLSPRMRFDLTVNEFARELFIGRELEVYDADTWRPYCHVRDFARLIRMVLEAPPAPVAFEVFNAGGDANNHTKRDIVERVLQRLPGRRVIYRANSPDPRDYRVSFEKVRSRLGFEPAFSVAEGIAEVIEALERGLFDDAGERRSAYGNYELSGLDTAENMQRARAEAS